VTDTTTTQSTTLSTPTSTSRSDRGSFGAGGSRLGMNGGGDRHRLRGSRVPIVATMIVGVFAARLLGLTAVA
jgi:hypothetical protein